MDNNKLWVIIPFYLDTEALEQCLLCLRQSSYKNWDVFVRDNSQDNIYFTAAVNEGFKAGLADPTVSDFLVLNQDAYLDQFAIEHLMAHMAQFPECGIACPLQTDQNQQVTWGGSLQAFPLGKHMSLPLAQYDRPFPTFWANGACMLIRRQVVEEIGLFDKNLRFICSDADYSFTARTRGWEVHVVPSARAVHTLSASSGEGSDAVNLIKAQDALYFYEKWLSGDVYRRISCEGPSLVRQEMEDWGHTLRTHINTEGARLDQVAADTCAKVVGD